jgi:hypothetical protein
VWAADHEMVKIQSNKHHLIHWISCITDRCTEHLKDKILAGWFPRRTVSTIFRPYLRAELKYWKTTRQQVYQDYFTIEYDESYYGECLKNRKLSECPAWDCKIHNNAKLIEWHKGRTVDDAEEEDIMNDLIDQHNENIIRTMKASTEKIRKVLKRREPEENEEDDSTDPDWPPSNYEESDDEDEKKNSGKEKA